MARLKCASRVLDVVPKEVLRSAVQFSVLVALFIIPGLELSQKLDVHTPMGYYCNQASQYGGILALIIYVPTLGAASKVGFELLLAQCAIWLGVAVIKIYSAAWFLALTSALVACVGFIIGQAANMPVGMGKLVAVAYIVEIFNASASNLVLGATARSVGIQLGVLCHLLVCSFVVPQPSSDKALQSLRSGLVSIKNMNKIAWNKRLWRRLAGLEEGKGGGGMGQAASTDSMAGAPATAVAQRSSVPASTDVPPAALSSDDAELLQALAHLAAFRQHMRDAANEAYVGSWCCSLRVYLPVLRGVLPERARHLPGPQLTELERCCLDATRTLWTLMLAVNKGIDEELEEVLAARYTPALVRELRSSSDAAFQDAIDAFVLDAPVVQGVAGAHLDIFINAAKDFLWSTAFHHQQLAHSFLHRAKDSMQSLLDLDSPRALATDPEDNASSAPAQEPRQRPVLHPGGPGSSAGMADSLPANPSPTQGSSSPVVTSTGSAPAPPSRPSNWLHRLAADLGADAPGSDPVMRWMRAWADEIEPGSPLSSPSPLSKCSWQHQPRHHHPPHLPTHKIWFPVSDKGFFGKVRWEGATQFAIAKLAEDLTAIHAAVDALLPRLPGACWQGRPLALQRATSMLAAFHDSQPHKIGS